MKDLCFKLIKDKRGYAFTVFILILIPLSIFLIIALSEASRTSRTADKNLQYSVEKAVSAAAMMVDPESQSQGNPHIAHKKAIDIFKKNLFFNLRLNSNGDAYDYSSVKDKVIYWVLFYNGDTDYSGYTSDYEVYSYAYYTNENGFEESYITNSITGLPHLIGIKDDGFTDNLSGDDISVAKLDSPGVVAIVRSNVNPMITNNSTTVTRWAYAKIVKKPMN